MEKSQQKRRGGARCKGGCVLVWPWLRRTGLECVREVFGDAGGDHRGTVIQTLLDLGFSIF